MNFLGKQIFAHGRFPKVGQKQKTEGWGNKERLNDGNNNGQATHGARKPPEPTMNHGKNNCQLRTQSRLGQKSFFTKADFLLFTASVRSRSLDQPLVPGVFPIYLVQHFSFESRTEFIGYLQFCLMVSSFYLLNMY